MSFPHLQQQVQPDLQKLTQQAHQQAAFNSPQVGQRSLNPLLHQQLQQQQLHQQPQQLSQQLLQQQLQQQQQQQQIPPQLHPQQIQLPQQQSQVTTIKEVWNDNFHQEFQIIRQLIGQFNYVSFSTEFPGILARPIGVFTSTNDYHYQTLRTNTDLLNLIQFGISLSDAKGEKPDNIHSTWQFNFKFDLNSRMISNDAFEALIKTGIDFHKHQLLGIDQFEFAEMLTSSGLILLPNVHWTSFHAGYDFGFLISMLTNNLMPSKEEDFVHKLQLFFPNLYDLKILFKHINRESDKSKSSLESLADDLNIPRSQLFVSTGGQALLTNLCLIELKNRSGGIEPLQKFKGVVHGLNSENQLMQQSNSFQLNSLSGHDL